jgi:hypothetical protein
MEPNPTRDHASYRPGFITGDTRMDTNLTAHFMATQKARAQLDARAARGWNVEQALATRAHASGATGLRRVVGEALIRTGERLQGLPRPAIPAIGADGAPAAARTM